MIKWRGILIFVIGLYFLVDLNKVKADSFQMVCVDDPNDYCKDKFTGHTFSDGCTDCKCLNKNGKCNTGKCKYMVKDETAAFEYCDKVFSKNKELYESQLKQKTQLKMKPKPKILQKNKIINSNINKKPKINKLTKQNNIKTMKKEVNLNKSMYHKRFRNDKKLIHNNYYKKNKNQYVKKSRLLFLLKKVVEKHNKSVGFLRKLIDGNKHKIGLLQKRVNELRKYHRMMFILQREVGELMLIMNKLRRRINMLENNNKKKWRKYWRRLRFYRKNKHGYRHGNHIKKHKKQEFYRSYPKYFKKKRQQRFLQRLKSIKKKEEQFSKTYKGFMKKMKQYMGPAGDKKDS